MKTKIKRRNKFGKVTDVDIIFGNEIFSASMSERYPKLGSWSLSRYRPDLSLSFMRLFAPIGFDFKSLAEIKKFIRDRKYL
jgi:hypothetical protein|tara:strand:- start:481 stop:723 length:243 start_codon:yes stop_codon:yes gene_type:complete